MEKQHTSAAEQNEKVSYETFLVLTTLNDTQQARKLYQRFRRSTFTSVFSFMAAADSDDPIDIDATQ